MSGARGGDFAGRRGLAKDFLPGETSLLGDCHRGAVVGSKVGVISTRGSLYSYSNGDDGVGLGIGDPRPQIGGGSGDQSSSSS